MLCCVALRCVALRCVALRCVVMMDVTAFQNIVGCGVFACRMRCKGLQT